MKNNTYILDKQTAKDICAIRKAQHTIDRIELDDGYGYRPPDSPNVAYLKNGVMLPPFRCDIAAKWSQLANKQQVSWVDPDTIPIEFSYSDKGEVTLRCGQSSVRLYPIEQGNEPPIHPLPIIFDGNRIKLELDAKEITAKAKLLTSNAARIKKEREQAAKLKAEQTALAEYERCKAIVTPEAVKRCAKRVKRLRALSQWIRNVEAAISYVPSLPQLRSNELFNAFDHEQEIAYGDARLVWIKATEALRDYKPRSWRAPGREKKQEAVKIAFDNVCRITNDALRPHVEACGFSLYGFGVNDHTEYNANDVRRCRKYIREYERKQTETQ